MQAVVFHGNGEWRVESAPVPQIRSDDDVLLRVDRASICGTDIHILAVPPGHPATPGSILGHEYVATVMDAGVRVEHVKPGDRVVVDPNITCGLCQYCRIGMTNICENMTTLGIFRDGGLAELNLAPAKSLHRIDRNVPLERATLAEPLSCVMHAFERAAIIPGESVAILGAGPIGLMFLMLFSAAGAGKVFVIEPVESRRKAAIDFGATHVFDSSGPDSARAIKAVNGIGADIVVDAAGILLPDALEIVRPGGRVVLFGLNQHAEHSIKQYLVTRYEITILGSFIQRTEFPKVVRLLESGILPLERLVTHRITLDEMSLGFEAMRSGEAIKVVAEPGM
jgi:threonine dehydrogenase-like Zn-dependent dehydrogenase